MERLLATRSQGGFSIVGVIIAAGIVGTISVFLIDQILTATRAQLSIEKRLEVAGIKQRLMFEIDCENTLAGITPATDCTSGNFIPLRNKANQVIGFAATLLFLNYDWPTKTAPATQTRPAKKWFTVFMILWCSVQILLPLRHWLYPGRVAWNLDGFYFSWMMKLNTRLGSGVFFVDTDQGRQTVDPDEKLSPMQAAATRTNPNEMVKYSRYLRQQFEAKGLRVDRVTNDVTIRLNDHTETPFANPEVDLSRVPYGIFTPNSWVLDP